MFQLVKPQRAEDENGIIVRSAGRFKLQYIDKARILEIPVCDDGRDENGVLISHVLFVTPLHWKSPHDLEEITDEKAQQIKVSLAEALSLMGTHPRFSNNIATL